MCILKIHSNSQSFKDLPALKKLPVYSIKEKGAILTKQTGKEHKSYSVSLDVSTAEWDSFQEQTNDAIYFLKSYEEDLSELLNHIDDAEAYLDFPLWSRLSSNIINQNDHLPKELIHLAGKLNLGIELAVYDQKAFNDLG